MTRMSIACPGHLRNYYNHQVLNVAHCQPGMSSKMRRPCHWKHQQAPLLRRSDPLTDYSAEHIARSRLCNADQKLDQDSRYIPLRESFPEHKKSGFFHCNDLVTVRSERALQSFSKGVPRLPVSDLVAAGTRHLTYRSIKLFEADEKRRVKLV